MSNHPRLSFWSGGLHQRCFAGCVQAFARTELVPSLYSASLGVQLPSALRHICFHLQRFGVVCRGLRFEVHTLGWSWAGMFHTQRRQAVDHNLEVLGTLCSFRPPSWVRHFPRGPAACLKVSRRRR